MTETGACGHETNWNDPHVRHEAPCAAADWGDACGADACGCAKVCLACCPTHAPRTPLAIGAAYLAHCPEQGDWPWGDHCEGVAGGILAGITDNGWRIVRFDPNTVEQGPLIITEEWKPQ